MSQLIAIYDTETTGLPRFKDPSDHPGQPHLVDLCILLFTPQGGLVDSFEAMIKPEGWTIPDEVAAIHGITTEMALEHGIPEQEALGGFLRVYEKAGLRVAHNVSFDDRIMRIAIKRFIGEQAADDFKAVPNYCTCQSSKNIVKCPPHRQDDPRRLRQAIQGSDRGRGPDALHRRRAGRWPPRTSGHRGLRPRVLRHEPACSGGLI